MINQDGLAIYSDENTYSIPHLGTPPQYPQAPHKYTYGVPQKLHATSTDPNAGVRTLATPTIVCERRERWGPHTSYVQQTLNATTMCVAITYEFSPCQHYLKKLVLALVANGVPPTRVVASHFSTSRVLSSLSINNMQIKLLKAKYPPNQSRISIFPFHKVLNSSMINANNNFGINKIRSKLITCKCNC